MPDERTRSLARRIRLLSLEAKYNIFSSRTALARRWAGLRAEVEADFPGTEVNCKLKKKLYHIDRCGQNIAMYTWKCSYAHSSVTRGRVADALMEAMFSDPLLWALHMTGIADEAEMVAASSEGAPVNFYGGARHGGPVNQTLSESMRAADPDRSRGALVFDDGSGGSRRLSYESFPWRLDPLVRPAATFNDVIAQEIEDEVKSEAKYHSAAPPHICPKDCTRKSPIKESVRVRRSIGGLTGSVDVTVSYIYTCEPDFGEPDDTTTGGETGQPKPVKAGDSVIVPAGLTGRPGAFKTTIDRWVKKPKCVIRGTAKPPRGHVDLCLTFEKWDIRAGPNKWKDKARIERAKAFEALDSSVFECDEGCAPEMDGKVEDLVEYSHSPLVGTKYVTCGRQYYVCLKDAEDHCRLEPWYTVWNDRRLFDQAMRFSDQCSARRDRGRSDDSRRHREATSHPQVEASEPLLDDRMPQPEQRVSMKQDPRLRYP